MVRGEDEMYRAPPKLVNIGKKLYPDWLYAFLKEPFKLRENFKVKMPNFQFTDQMTSDLVAYFIEVEVAVPVCREEGRCPV